MATGRLLVFAEEDLRILRDMVRAYRAGNLQPRRASSRRVPQNPPPEFWARITAHAPAGDNRWTYTFEEVFKESAGYDGWAAKENGRSGTAYNDIEDMNSAAGIQGNGVDVANLDTDDYTFEIQPCPVDNIVWIRQVWGVDDDPEYWFSYENGVDGGCDAGSGAP